MTLTFASGYKGLATATGGILIGQPKVIAANPIVKMGKKECFEKG
jgi:hypothetical protein